MPAKILIAGEGGQGVQTIAKILAKAAKDSGKNIAYIPGFGVEQRGGASLAFVQISNNPISYPRFYKADFIVVFCSRAIPVIKEYVGEKTLFIYDNSQVEEKSLEKVKDVVKSYLSIPAQSMAQKDFSTKTLNMILLGALSNNLKDISFSAIEENVEKELGKKIAEHPELKELNLKALKAGVDHAMNFDMAQSRFTGAEAKEILREFKDEKKKWTRFPEYCKGCGLCIVNCPVGALKFSSDLGFLGNRMPVIDISKCIACGKCMEICPDAAINLEKFSSQQVEKTP